MCTKSHQSMRLARRDVFKIGEASHLGKPQGRGQNMAILRAMEMPRGGVSASRLLRRGNRLPVETAAYASPSPYYMPTQPGAEAPTFPATPAYPADDLSAPSPLPESTTPTPE